jgi:hypothetical protein
MIEVTNLIFAANAAERTTLYLAEGDHLPFSEAKVEVRGERTPRWMDLVLYGRDGQARRSG